MPDVKRRVLVVDDEELNVNMLSRRLMRSGFAVDAADNGADAISLIAESTYDVVLLDHMMPNMSGREVLAHLRSIYTPEALPIIMVTAIAESDKIAEALGAGANDYITKPIDFHVALARIEVQIARSKAEAALRCSEERYALAARASRDGLWDWNLETGQVYFSPRWMQMNGLGQESCTGSPELWFGSVFPADVDSLKACVQQHLAGNAECLVSEYRVQQPDGCLRWMTTRAVTSRDAGGRAIRLSGSQSDVTEEKTRDSLTQLPNRVALRSTLEALHLKYRRSRKDECSRYGLLFLDLDGFKAVNDSLGHLAGDALLCSVAARLKSCTDALFTERPLAALPLIARMSGDEFAVLIESDAVEADATAFAQHVQQQMSVPIVLGETPVHVAFSIGIASVDTEHERFEELLCDADMAMYAAKAAGRGSTVFFTPELRSNALDRLQLENDLRSALAREEFYLVYQPTIRLQDGSIHGIEALLRWQHPTRGLVNPGQFIPLAEQTGCIIEIGRWVLHSACEQVMAWQVQFPLSPPLELSVNLSPREFKQKGLVEGIAEVLRKTGLPAACLHLEITEGVLFEDLPKARKSLLALKELGVALDLDDFGSGYSSLRYLQELPFDTLKIDRYFLSSLETDIAGASKMLETIMTLAGHLDMKVVAEGIEKTPDSHLLREMGCDFGQGFLFSRPVRASEVALLLAQELTTQNNKRLAGHVGCRPEEATDLNTQEAWA